MSSRSLSLGVFLSACLLLHGSRLQALEAKPAEPASWTLYVENDSFLSTDRYYTNGIRLTAFGPRPGSG
jgi:hypothetical protein